MTKQLLFILVCILLSAASISAQTNNAIAFDGVDDYVEVADNDELDLISDYSIEAWIYPTSLNSSGMGIVSKYQTSAANGYFLRFSLESDPVLEFDGLVADEFQISTNTWYHVVAVNDNSTRKLYVNGEEQELSGSLQEVSTNTDNLRIGSDYSGRYFNGIIDEVAIWGKALTQNEVLDNMTNGNTGEEDDLVAYYNKNQGTAEGDNSGITTVINATGTHLDGTLNNSSLSGSTSNWVNGYEYNDTSTAVSEISTTEISVYPNPATSIINVSGSSNIVYLYDLSGNMVLSQDLSVSNSINLSQLSKGVYLLNVDGESIKVVKQ